MKVAFHTLGCKVNSYETQAILEQFQKNGFDIVAFSEASDVYVINTCSVTAEAARKSRQMMHKCKKLSPNCIVVACGCYVQEAKEELLDELGADIVVGNNEKSAIISLVKEFDENRKRCARIDDLTHCNEYEPQDISYQTGHVRAYVKIQDGCNRFCSYCIIPFLRGRSRSRQMVDVEKEVRILAENGYKEVVLTGIDISDYLGNGPEKLIELIEVINEIEGIERIRLGSLELSLITDDFVKRLSECKKVCPQFHLSLQSGCDETLKRMNRKYTACEYLDALKLLRKSFDNPAITTDIIVGFVGETEEEFNKSKDFAVTAGFAAVHVFPYSRRKGTKADMMTGQLTKAQKAKRVDSMMEVTDKLEEMYVNGQIGKDTRVLIEEEVTIDGANYQIGFSENYIKCGIKADENLVNNIVTIKPQKAMKFKNEWILI